ncbi:helix-turn-helix domain-containing protein [Nonomuraea fuscirosea]|uniref:helix-turn-helix domain-containing protein n=1 Tax=Nonomuraea fuscirosea TaxID=1291556 RepID=UPI0033DB521D
MRVHTRLDGGWHRSQTRTLRSTHSSGVDEAADVRNGIRLDAVPVRERFDFWWQAVAESVVSVDASSDNADDFWAEMRSVDLGTLRLSRVRCYGFEARRTASRIRYSDPEAYQLAVAISGRSGICQEERETNLAPADLTLYDVSRPFVAWNSPDGHRAPGGPGNDISDGLILQVPHAAVSLPVLPMQRLLAGRISGREGLGTLLSGLLHNILVQTECLSRVDMDRLSGVIVDLLTAVVAHEIEIDPSPSMADPGALLVLRIQAFIDQHLDELDLSAADIAAAHHISLRHMQRLFAKEGHTIRGWIQQRRLERCRRALADPQMDSLPTSLIAARWGFSSEAHFNRLFRRTYGAPPAGYRRQLRSGQSQQARQEN